MSLEELEQVNGGSGEYGPECEVDVIIDGVKYVGGKVADGARWLWNGIKSIF